jgi:hypothetical protein
MVKYFWNKMSDPSRKELINDLEMVLNQFTWSPREYRDVMLFFISKGAKFNINTFNDDSLENKLSGDMVFTPLKI